jgi:hypothetical protein
MSDDKEDTVTRLLRKLGKQQVEYPQFNKRRRQLKFWQLSRNPACCFLSLLTIIVLVLTALYFIYQ